MPHGLTQVPKTGQVVGWFDWLHMSLFEAPPSCFAALRHACCWFLARLALSVVRLKQVRHASRLFKGNCMLLQQQVWCATKMRQHVAVTTPA